MPPFINTDCPHCHKLNRFNLAELKNNNANITKGVIYRAVYREEEFEVSCQHCGREFKFSLEVNDDK